MSTCMRGQAAPWACDIFFLRLAKSGWLIGWSIACAVAWLACRRVGCWLVDLMLGWSAGVWLRGRLLLARWLGMVRWILATVSPRFARRGEEVGDFPLSSRAAARHSHPRGDLYFFCFFFWVCLLGC